MKAVCLWSGPRNVSTALMYSFAQRTDTRVVDEPLYGHFLRVTGADHPGRNDIMPLLDCDGPKVMQALLGQSPGDAEILFIKLMAHHLVDLDREFMRQTRNIFLIRDPREMLPSLTIQLPHARLDDTGLETQWELFTWLEKLGQTPAILDSRELLLDPPGVLRQLCEHLEINYTDDMLTWNAGPIAEDGVWAPYWYHAVHKSTGFSPYVAKGEFPRHLQPLLDECHSWYEKLYSRAIRATGGK
jgi:Sulfotransferase domain